MALFQMQRFHSTEWDGKMIANSKNLEGGDFGLSKGTEEDSGKS
jgi:hypothetical protein